MKKKMIALFALLAAVALTGFSVSGTYAKYVSTISGTTDSARVAKWAFEVNGGTVKDSFEFDLFETIKDTGDQEELDVKTGGEKIIAPGTEGSFKISLENKSEVKAKVEVDYTVTNEKSIPIEFSADKDSWTTDLTDLEAEELAMENGKKDITIYWRWTYEASGRNGDHSSDSDETDTNLGKADEAATVTVKADIKVTQVD